MDRQAVANAINDLCSSFPDIRGCALIADDGHMVASSLKPGIDPEQLSAVSIAALKLGVEAASGLGCGALEQVTLKGESGYVLLVRETDDAVLTVITGSSARVGLILQDARRAVSSLT